MKERLDKLLVQRGLAGSRERARALILAGKVIVDDHRIDKAGAQVQDDADLRLKGEDIPFVSRGGLKLEKALNEFSINVKAKIAIDVGASTGGFSDCLLQHGAKKVYAVDVGYGQLAWRLREDPRIVNLERCNIRYLQAEQLDDAPELAVVDASFISLEKVLPNTLRLLTKDAEIVALIKPQFEVGKGKVGKGGVVKDQQQHEQVIEQICAFTRDLNCTVLGTIESPILGPKGNREFLIYMQKHIEDNQATDL
ncbi:TlyA family RNA methyltransferase [uncultured Desulfuromusa sp.]|uniref:TlyA family RNA methyltransferase n=1 Tax=uncultured Desulfuromusa sp. TaxID=219183 RepID=UPI002AA6628F|nr:TlyA family RNA methyltransferase [uncultured Desulfuromusa sp.]